MAEIRFHRNDYTKLVSGDFYSIKNFPNYDIFDERTDKKVGSWSDKNGGSLKYNKSKTINDWLKKNSYLKINEDFGMIGTTYIDKTTEPDAVVRMQEILDKDFKDYKIVGKLYTPGDTLFNFVLETSLDDFVTYSTEMSRPKLILKMNEFKNEFSEKVSAEFPLVGVNIMNYQFAKNENKLKFSFAVLLSRTSIVDWVTGRTDKGIIK